MRFVFTADLHGNLTQYHKVFRYAEKNNIQLIVLGGDLTPKNPELRNPEAQKCFLENDLFPLIKNYFGKVLLIMGNDDYKRNLQFLEENQQTIGYNLIYEPYEVEGFYFAGYTYVPYTPFVGKDWERRDLESDTKSDLRADVLESGTIDFDKPYNILADMPLHSIEKDLKKLIKDIQPDKLVLVTHTPPADTNADLTKDKSGNLIHVGSRAVKKIINEHQPLLTLHGHIHDAVQNSGIFPEVIGKTICGSVSNDHIGNFPYVIDVEIKHAPTLKRIRL